MIRGVVCTSAASARKMAGMFISIILVASYAMSTYFAVAPPPGTIQVHQRAIAWKDGPPTLPKGTKVAVLEGDPKAPGIFTMRLKIPAGSKVMPHWHPRPERVTILSGKVAVGFGDKWDEKDM